MQPIELYDIYWFSLAKAQRVEQESRRGLLWVGKGAVNNSWFLLDIRYSLNSMPHGSALVYNARFGAFGFQQK